MTNMGIRTAAAPGLLSARLAQAEAGNHFAGFHIGICIGTGWIAGRSAVEDQDRLPAPALDAAEVRTLHAERDRERKDAAEAASDRVLRDLQASISARISMRETTRPDCAG